MPGIEVTKKNFAEHSSIIKKKIDQAVFVCKLTEHSKIKESKLQYLLDILVFLYPLAITHKQLGW